MIDKVDQRHTQLICNGSKPNSILIFVVYFMEKKSCSLRIIFKMCMQMQLVQPIFFFVFYLYSV